ncbi:hypothetical protein HPB50_006850 [Hyalomma asiaticum]|uniref:Uncharacterized protein n=1 Tax=Hyalomma asiaticum TaxID=266040 RepID=A0ACB7T6L5_HYAAI|nr:hypothetical protein HPB50_006850 [Hyalomma asiaticum]
MTDSPAQAEVPDAVCRAEAEKRAPGAPQNTTGKQSTKQTVPLSSPISAPLAPPGPTPGSPSKSVPLFESPTKQPRRSPLQKPSRSAKKSAPFASHGDAATCKTAATGMDTPSVLLMRRWLQRHRIFMCRCTLSTSLAVISAAVLVLVYLRQDLLYPSQRLRRPSPFLCLKAAEEVRATLNFTVNPCDDFYSFVCGVGGDVKDDDGRRVEGDVSGPVRGEGVTSAWEEIERKLLSIPWEPERHGVENKAARVFRSCRRLVSAPTVYVKEHADVLFALVPEVSVDALRLMNSPEKMLELLSSVSLKYGLSACLCFAPGPEGTSTVMAVRPPLSTYLDDIDLRLAFANTVEILEIAYTVASRTVQRLIEIDHDLRRHHDTPRQHGREPLSNPSLSTAVYANKSPAQDKDQPGSSALGSHVMVSSRERDDYYGGHGKKETSSFPESKETSGSSAHEDIVATFLPPAKYRVRVADLGALRRTLHAVFEDMNGEERAAYVLASLLLPEDLLLTYGNRNDKSICYKFLRFAFWNVWGPLTTRVSLAVNHTGDALFITEAVLGTLRKMIAHRDGKNSPATSVAEEQIGELLTSLSGDKDIADPRSTDVLGSMDVRSLYRNILELGIWRRVPPPTSENVSSVRGNSDKRGQPLQFRVPVEDLTPPFYCQGAFRFLNYATFGVSVALEALKVIGLMSSEAESTTTTPASSIEGVRPVRSCFAAEISSLHWPDLEGGSAHEREKLLDDVILWATGFRVALEASELERSRTPREFVEPVMLQTFYARYCYHLCERAEDPFFRHEDTRWPHLKCNLAVMNAPQFASLFRCKQDHVLFKTEYCSVI